MRLVVTGGGTGGHIFSGIAIAQEFLSQSKANQVLFVGSEVGLETRLVPKAGIKLETLKLGKLMGQPALAKIITLFQIPIAVLKCLLILKRFKADMVVGVGGFAAGPCILAARIAGISTGILEQNSVMGFTNRICARLSDFVFTAFEETPIGAQKQKCIFTGNPARSSLKPKSVKIQKPFVIFVFGGSQGASGINRLMLEAADFLSSLGEDIRIIHQTGERDFENTKAQYAEKKINVEVHRFIDDMQSMYDRASLVVCRSGSGTIAELGATQNASILVPFPQAASNHQEMNARAVERAGAAIVCLQDTLSGEGFAKLIIDLVSSPSKLEEMRRNAAIFFKVDAAKRILELMKTKTLIS